MFLPKTVALGDRYFHVNHIYMKDSYSIVVFVSLHWVYPMLCPHSGSPQVSLQHEKWRYLSLSDKSFFTLWLLVCWKIPGYSIWWIIYEDFCHKNKNNQMKTRFCHIYNQIFIYKCDWQICLFAMSILFLCSWHYCCYLFGLSKDSIVYSSLHGVYVESDWPMAPRAGFYLVHDSLHWL